MSYVTETLSNLIHQTAFFNLTWGNYLMIAVACVFLFLAIKKGFEPLLLVPIAFGMLLVNIYPDIMANPEDMSNGVGGLLHYFYLLDEWSILPSLIFMGVGAMTDFGPLIANPKSFLLGAAAQLGIYVAYFLAIFLGFNGKAAAAISIIGGADGPTSIFLAGKLGQTTLMGPIAVAAYSYMSLVPIIQPPIMKLCTTEKERKIKMDQLRPVSKLEKILFPIVITIVVCLLLPTTAPLVGMLMLGNLFRESGVVKQLTETASNAMMYIVVILLGTSVGASTSAEAFLNLDTLKIVALGLIAFAFGTAGGVLFGKLMCITQNCFSNFNWFFSNICHSLILSFYYTRLRTWQPSSESVAFVLPYYTPNTAMKVPAATAVPITPATLGPIACISRKLVGSASAPTF